MSCWPSHEVQCSQVLDAVDDYLQGGLDEEQLAPIRAHLQECPPCLHEYGLQRVVRDLVHRSCRCTPAPDSLRAAIILRITAVRSEGRRC